MSSSSSSEDTVEALEETIGNDIYCLMTFHSARLVYTYNWTVCLLRSYSSISASLRTLTHYVDVLVKSTGHGTAAFLTGKWLFATNMAMMTHLMQSPT